MSKIILSADSACDIGPELREEFDVHLFPFHILLGGKSYMDGVDITSEEMYQAYREKGLLPKTAAVTPADYTEHFGKWVEEGYQVIHLCLGSALSSSFQNAQSAADEMGSVFVVDSASLSTGFGLLVVKAGEMIREGRAALDIVAELALMRERTHASFVLDTLEFMRAGGRCNAVTAFGANLLKLKPCIEVNNHAAGSMSVGKKYRGAMERVLPEYVKDCLSGRDNLDLARVFITHSGSPAEDITLVKGEIEKYAKFEKYYVTSASGTISAHCGPRTLGVLFMTNERN